jgi:hypothetical protein
MPMLIPPMYTIEKSVGHQGVNSVLDVKLIQYFLYSINFDAGWGLSSIIKNSAGPGGGIVVFPHDGKARPELGEWIRNFQRDFAATGLGTLVTDGRVNPVVVAWGNKTINVPNKRTIQAFNQVMWRGNRDRFMKLQQDQSVPADLRAQLGIMRLEVG